ncbi:hypothetical protein LCM00_20335 [Bacillus infantis]|uniref:hypothetical protein n=1 Tax=Bacillus infantis TaxID=324767 RepID=UPI001CD42FBA|nr:hypothetical protein [Bacillus infantis]MCA1041848.1 hypothetical protein [Bacillus infantis]
MNYSSAFHGTLCHILEDSARKESCSKGVGRKKCELIKKRAELVKLLRESVEKSCKPVEKAAE